MATRRRESPSPEIEEDETRGPGPAQLSRPGAELHRRVEVCVLRLHNDPAKNATIGVGHLVQMGPINCSEPAEFKKGITRERALALLMEDAESAAPGRSGAITQPLKHSEFQRARELHFQPRRGEPSQIDPARRLNAGNCRAVRSELMKWSTRAAARSFRDSSGAAVGALFVNGKSN